MISSKRKRSNEQRLRAVEEKRARLQSRQLSIKVTNGVSASNQHTVFTSDSEDSTSIEKERRLELFGDSGSGSEGEQELVENWGEKFERERGVELFQLQQKIGHDARFRVDERFLEEKQVDEEVVPVRQAGGAKKEAEDDDIREQIEREKENALQIINAMFGSGGQKLPSANRTHVLPRRYDPNSDTCAELELVEAPPRTTPPLQETLSPSGENSDIDSDSPDTRSPAQQVQTEAVASERYYNVSENIKELFSSSNEKFSFLSDMGRDSDDSSMDDSSANDMTSKSSFTAPKWIKNINRTQPSSSSEDNELESAKVAPTDGEAGSIGSGGTREVRLFFHSSVPELRNRLEENSFYRSKALSDLEATWPQRRAAMKQSFRKRRKDAVKRARKRQKIQ